MSATDRHLPPADVALSAALRALAAVFGVDALRAAVDALSGRVEALQSPDPPIVVCGVDCRSAQVEIHDIARAVALKRGVSFALIMGARGKGASPISRARQEAMALAMATGRWTAGQVGEVFGRDRSTVSHAEQRIAELRAAGALT